MNPEIGLILWKIREFLISRNSILWRHRECKSVSLRRKPAAGNPFRSLHPKRGYLGSHRAARAPRV